MNPETRFVLILYMLAMLPFMGLWMWLRVDSLLFAGIFTHVGVGVVIDVLDIPNIRKRVRFLLRKTVKDWI